MASQTLPATTLPSTKPAGTAAAAKIVYLSVGYRTGQAMADNLIGTVWVWFEFWVFIVVSILTDVCSVYGGSVNRSVCVIPLLEVGVDHPVGEALTTDTDAL